MATSRTFEIDPRLQVVIAILLTETANVLEEQKSTRVPVRIYGAQHDLPFRSEAESDRDIALCRNFAASIWDRAAADLLANGEI